MSTAFLPACTHQLANGLTVIVHPIPITDVVTVDIWVTTGGRHEPSHLLGVSHFLEHMVFKGTDRLGPGALDHAVEGRGGMTNAATGQDYTHYFMTVAGCDLAEMFPYLVQVVTEASIPDDEFGRERLVVLEEIRRAADNPDHQAYHHLMATAYTCHPYGRPVLGTTESLMGLTPEMMRAYHGRWYQPDRMTVVIVGDISIDAALKMVQSHMGSGEAPERLPLQIPVEPSLTSVKRSELHLPRLEQARLLMAWPTISIDHWNHVCGLEVLASILGDGRTSRLVKFLREERGWVRGIGSASMVQQDPGLFYVSAYLDPDQLERVEASILSEVDRLQQECVPLEELERTRRILTNDWIFSTESPSQLASLYGYYNTIGGIEQGLAYLDHLRQITPADVQALAQTYLKQDAYIMTSVKPEVQAPRIRPQLELMSNEPSLV